MMMVRESSASDPGPRFTETPASKKNEDLVQRCANPMVQIVR